MFQQGNAVVDSTITNSMVAGKQQKYKSFELASTEFRSKSNRTFEVNTTKKRTIGNVRQNDHWISFFWKNGATCLYLHTCQELVKSMPRCVAAVLHA